MNVQVSDAQDPAREPDLVALLVTLNRETDDLKKSLPGALARQWEASPVPKPREDTTQRASGLRSDPTADAVLDARRLAVRETVAQSGIVLREAIARVRAVRAAVDTAVTRYDGERA